MKDRSKKGFNRGWLLMILAVILIGTAMWNIARPYIDRFQSKQVYKKLSEKVVETSNDGREKKKDWWSTEVKINFDELKVQNSDIIGWIRFDDTEETEIDYPILYSGDNKKYLRRDIYGNYHIAGSVFLEGKNNPDMSDNYNIVYGHNMNDGSMFGQLKKYREDGFMEEHPYFTVYTQDTAYRYRIFACQHAKNRGPVFRVGYQIDEEYRNFIDGLIEASDVDTGIYPSETDKILTLSTCTGNGYSKRMTVHAVCIDEQRTENVIEEQ